MLHIAIKPSDKLVKGYYDVLGGLGQLHFDHEGAVRSAFHDVLAGYGKKLHWTLVDEYPMKGRNGRIAIDGALLDEWKQRHGFWEAKDIHDQLEKEIKRKLELGYPTTNTIFQMPERAILYQNGVRLGLNEDITAAKNLVELLHSFFAYRQPDHEEWDSAVSEFKQRIPELAARAKEIIDGERKSNKDFREAFQSFYDLCRKAINPNLSDAAVEEMLIQHLLTERIFRRVFHAEEFRSRNVIAAEIEKVITSMTSRHFSRDQFLSDLDRFYKALERAAEGKDDYSEKQSFLNTVYERFFHGYSPKEADTRGVVYTPQAIVDFMVRSVEDILKKEFGRSLADKNVHILDPFVGTGNFITRVMREIAETDKGALPYKYENELHCNEVMLLPYYIASMNIEHEYLAQTGDYRPFDGICLADTFDITRQTAAFTEENSRRIEEQKRQPIFVIVGNPPYNAWQISENDNNKNRKYSELDERISETYAKSSTATNKNALHDQYVRAIRWASDRIGGEGCIAFVTNSGFVDAIATDGVRKHLRSEFDEIYILDLGGNVRHNPKLSGTTHNVFGIQVGVSISLLIRHNISRADRRCKLFYARTEEFWRKERKYQFLDSAGYRGGLTWATLTPDDKENWLTDKYAPEFNNFPATPDIFTMHSCSVATGRDLWVINFDKQTLLENVTKTAAFYNAELARWQLLKKKEKDDVDAFVTYDDKLISWSRDLKADLRRYKTVEVAAQKVVSYLYRPFTQQHLYFDRVLNEEVYSVAEFMPRKEGQQNVTISVTGIGSEKPFMCMCSASLTDMHLTGGGCRTMSFPYYTYSADGSNRRENITDWALEQFRSHYHDPSITKWDIFHYVYAVLHHPEYRSRYAANLKRELPRIPFLGAASTSLSEGHDFSRAEQPARASESSRVAAPEYAAQGVSPGKAKQDSSSSLPKAGAQPQAERHKEIFWKFAEAGKRLAELHVHYEQQPEYPLEKIWNPQAKLDYRVTKMRLSKDKSILFYNDALTLKGIPLQTYDYRLGNRSALEWVIDQYQISTDKRSGITNDPNRADDKEYILRLTGQVITVSLETVTIVKALPEFVIADSASAAASK